MFDKISFIDIAPLDVFDTIVTNAAPSKAWLDYFAEHGIECLYPARNKTARLSFNRTAALLLVPHADRYFSSAAVCASAVFSFSTKAIPARIREDAGGRSRLNVP